MLFFCLCICKCIKKYVFEDQLMMFVATPLNYLIHRLLTLQYAYCLL